MVNAIIMLLWLLACNKKSSVVLQEQEEKTAEVISIERDVESIDLDLKKSSYTVVVGDVPFPKRGEIITKPLGEEECSTMYKKCISKSETEFVPSYRSSIEILDDETVQKMLNITWKEGCPVPYTDLRKVRMLHVNLTNGVQWGELIVHMDVASEIEAVFEELYAQFFPMKSLKPMYHFDGSDDASMAANNTSGFNCRKIKNSTRYSEHSYGKAIDVNPFFNPWVKGTRVDPPTAIVYSNRTPGTPGLILDDSEVVQSFKRHGWFWGGDWRSLKDYQHFSKSGR